MVQRAEGHTRGPVSIMPYIAACSFGSMVVTKLWTFSSSRLRRTFLDIHFLHKVVIGVVIGLMDRTQVERSHLTFRRAGRPWHFGKRRRPNHCGAPDVRAVPASNPRSVSTAPRKTVSRSWSSSLCVSLAIYSGCCCQRQHKICRPGLQAQWRQLKRLLAKRTG